MATLDDTIPPLKKRHSISNHELEPAARSVSPRPYGQDDMITVPEALPIHASRGFQLHSGCDS